MANKMRYEKKAYFKWKKNEKKTLPTAKYRISWKNHQKNIYIYLYVYAFECVQWTTYYKYTDDDLNSVSVSEGIVFSYHYFIHLCFYFYNFMIAKTYNENHTIERSAQHINHFNRCHEDGWISKCCNCVSYWIKRKRKINS